MTTPILSLLIILPLVGSPLAYLTMKRSSTAGLAVSVAFALATLAVAVYSFWSVYSNVPGLNDYRLEESYSWVSTSVFSFDLLFGVDGLSSPLVLATGLLTVFALIASRRLITQSAPSFFALILLFEGAIMGVFVSLNLVLFYVFWELVMIPMFFLIGVWGGDRRRYAAMKFMVYIFTGSTIMLLSFLAVYLDTPLLTFDIPSLSGAVPQGLQYLPLLASFIGFAVKLPLVPFHGWLPDAYSQAPAPAAVLLAGVQSAMGGYGIIRVSIGLFPYAAQQWAWIFLALGLITMFYGAFVALFSGELKRMFAYTSLNHMGFVVFGAFATVISGDALGMEGAIFQMFVHAFTAGALFMVAGYIQQQAGTTEISKLGGLRDTMPRTAGLLVLAAGAAMALPPFGSFLAEIAVLAGGIQANSYMAVAIFVPVLTGGYLLWMIRRVILTAAPEKFEVRDAPWADSITLVAYVVPLILLLVFSYVIFSPAAPVAQWLIHLTGGAS